MHRDFTNSINCSITFGGHCISALVDILTNACIDIDNHSMPFVANVSIKFTASRGTVIEGCIKMTLLLKQIAINCDKAKKALCLGQPDPP